MRDRSDHEPSRPILPMPAESSPDWLAPYDYSLPREQIASSPANPRDSSRLLVLDRDGGARTQTGFRKLPGFLREGDLLVVNTTRVLPARLMTRLERTGRAVEVLLSHSDGESWQALLGPGRRLNPGDRLLIEALPRAGEAVPDAPYHGVLLLEEKLEQGLWRLRPESGVMDTLLERSGHVPLPPYLDREDLPDDRDWYQTVFAREPGAVAAPTAGLHFTKELLEELEAAGVQLAQIVLHVGPGTFMPVRADREKEHRVLPERYQIAPSTAAAVNRAKSSGRRVIAVGTTTVRALESTAWTAGEGRTIMMPAAGWTNLTIREGYSFRVVDAMITNFHLPRSSLLLLVAAFAGRRAILDAYEEARDAGFRFYSYGDAMLIL